MSLRETWESGEAPLLPHPEGRRRLIEDHDPATPGRRAGEIDLLPLTPGELCGLTKLFLSQRPMPPPDRTHFTVVEDGELAPVENEDYRAALLRLESGAVGTCEASRVTVGPRCQMAIDVYGTEGAVAWGFERMNELRVGAGAASRSRGHATVHTGPGHGEHGRFRPGPAIAMGFDDLKVIEAAGFLRSIEPGVQEGPGAADALVAARVLDAVARASGADAWQPVAASSAQP